MGALVGKTPKKWQQTLTQSACYYSAKIQTCRYAAERPFYLRVEEEESEESNETSKIDSQPDISAIVDLLHRLCDWSGNIHGSD